MVTLDFCFKTFNLSLKRHRTSSAALVVWSRFKKGLKHHNLKLLVILLLLTFLVDNQDDDNNDDILRAKNWWSLIKIIGRSRAGVELAVTKGGQSFTSLGRGFEYWVIYITALVVWWSGGRIISLNHFFCHCLWKKRGKNTVWEKHVFVCRSLSLLVIRIGIRLWCI